MFAKLAAAKREELAAAKREERSGRGQSTPLETRPSEDSPPDRMDSSTPWPQRHRSRSRKRSSIFGGLLADVAARRAAQVNEQENQVLPEVPPRKAVPPDTGRGRDWERGEPLGIPRRLSPSPIRRLDTDPSHHIPLSEPHNASRRSTWTFDGPVQTMPLPEPPVPPGEGNIAAREEPLDRSPRDTLQDAGALVPIPQSDPPSQRPDFPAMYIGGPEIKGDEQRPSDSRGSDPRGSDPSGPPPPLPSMLDVVDESPPRISARRDKEREQQRRARDESPPRRAESLGYYLPPGGKVASFASAGAHTAKVPHGPSGVMRASPAPASRDKTRPSVYTTSWALRTFDRRLVDISCESGQQLRITDLPAEPLKIAAVNVTPTKEEAQLRQENDELKKHCNRLQQERDRLQQKHNCLLEEHDRLQQDHDRLRRDTRKAEQVTAVVTSESKRLADQLRSLINASKKAGPSLALGNLGLRELVPKYVQTRDVEADDLRACIKTLEKDARDKTVYNELQRQQNEVKKLHQIAKEKDAQVEGQKKDMSIMRTGYEAQLRDLKNAYAMEDRNRHELHLQEVQRLKASHDGQLARTHQEAEVELERFQSRLDKREVEHQMEMDTLACVNAEAVQELKSQITSLTADLLDTANTFATRAGAGDLRHKFTELQRLVSLTSDPANLGAPDASREDRLQLRGRVWRVLMDGFFSLEFGFGAFGRETAGQKGLLMMYKAWLGAAGIKANAALTQLEAFQTDAEANKWRSSTFQLILDAVTTKKSDPVSQGLVKMHGDNCEQIGTELTSLLREAGGGFLTVDMPDVIAEMARRAGELALEFGARPARLDLDLPAQGDDVEIGHDFEDCNGQNVQEGGSATVEFAVSPSFYSVGNGRDDLDTVRVLVLGQVYSRHQEEYQSKPNP